MYQERFYRYNLKHQHILEVAYKESDLYIVSDRALDQAQVKESLAGYYSQIEDYIKKNPDFFTSLSPLIIDEGAPEIVKDMHQASCLSKIGPFSSVAGAIASYVGRDFIGKCSQISEF